MITFETWAFEWQDGAELSMAHIVSRESTKLSGETLIFIFYLTLFKRQNLFTYQILFSSNEIVLKTKLKIHLVTADSSEKAENVLSFYRKG